MVDLLGACDQQKPPDLNGAMLAAFAPPPPPWWWPFCWASPKDEDAGRADAFSGLVAAEAAADGAGVGGRAAAPGCDGS